MINSIPLTGVDSHAHVFHPHLPLAQNSRYTPDYDANVQDYLRHLDKHQLSHGILVQPSFLGTDNHYMLEALAAHPHRLRGIAVISSECSEHTLDQLDAQGVVGIRLNLVGKSLEDYRAQRWQTFFRLIRDYGWSVEIQRRLPDLPQILPAILETGVTVVVDHFGLPEKTLNPSSHSDQQAFLNLLTNEKVWLKASALYRWHASYEAGRQALQLIRQACDGLPRVVWGSDWPHTRFEQHADYSSQYQGLEQLLPDSAERQTVLIDNPRQLFQL